MCSLVSGVDRQDLAAAVAAASKRPSLKLVSATRKWAATLLGSVCSDAAVFGQGFFGLALLQVDIA